MRIHSLIAVLMLVLTPTVGVHAQACTAPEPVCKAASNVVMISSFEPIGSAVLVSDGILITNRHMVADNPDVEVTLADGTKLQATVVPTDYPGDLVGVMANGTKGSLPHRVQPVDADTELYVIGFDVGRQAVRVYAPGHLIVPKADTPLARLHHDARSLPGNSGGALVDSKGALVGFVAAGGEGRNEAIPVAALASLLASEGPDKITASMRIGTNYRLCVERLDALQRAAKPMAEDVAGALSEVCLATGNRELIDLAGQAFGTSRDLQRALAMLKESSRIDPNAPNSLISLAVTYHIAGLFADEIPVLNHGLALMPDEPQLLRLALQAGIWGGDQALADKAMKQIETVLPQMAPAARRFYESRPPAPRLKKPN